MNKIVVWIVLIIIVIGLSVLIILQRSSPFGKSNSSFFSDPSADITRIELSEGSRKMYLVKENGNWLINGKEDARKTGVFYLIRILQEIKIKSPVSPELFESEVTSKGLIPIKVKVFEKRKLLKSFLVYKTRSNVYGNIMKINQQSKPFIVYMPGFEGDIGSGFVVNELFWQNYTLFNLMPSEISSVKLENLSDTASSFSIINKNHHFELPGTQPGYNTWDSTLVTRYISYFARVPFESWLLEPEGGQQKIIESQQPLYKLIVTTHANKQTILTLWERTKDNNGIQTKDTDRLWGKTQDHDELFSIRYFDIDPVLKKRSYFFRE
jgi:hypothetical protein